MTNRERRLLSLLLGTALGLVACFAAYYLLRDPRSQALSLSAFAIVFLMTTMPFVVSSLAAEKTKKSEDLLPMLDPVWPELRRARTAISALAASRLRQARAACTVLVSTALSYLGMSRWFGWPLSADILIAMVGASVVISISSFVLRFRICRGVFGTDEYEARELVEYVLHESSGSDLSGGVGGDPIRETIDEQTLAALWNENPA